MSQITYKFSFENHGNKMLKYNCIYIYASAYIIKNIYSSLFMISLANRTYAYFNKTGELNQNESSCIYFGKLVLI